MRTDSAFDEGEVKLKVGESVADSVGTMKTWRLYSAHLPNGGTRRAGDDMVEGDLPQRGSDLGSVAVELWQKPRTSMRGHLRFGVATARLAHGSSGRGRGERGEEGASKARGEPRLDLLPGHLQP
jgi:hypothetical protein